MQALADRLIQQRYAVDIASDGQSAEGYIGVFNYDLVVLDLALPDGNGIKLCQVFRQSGYHNPLLMLTAHASTDEKVRALDAGADDYVVKPFNFDELCARIRALLRREHQALPSVLRWQALTLNPSTCETRYQDQPFHLTPKEMGLLELFLRHPDRVYSLDAIIEDLWSFEDPPSEDAVRTHIKGLRQKLKAVGAPKDLIKTVYGLGYRLKSSADDDRPVTSRHAEPKLAPTAAQNGLSQAVAAAWEKYQHMMAERIEVLDEIAIALSQGGLNHDLLKSGQVAVHKLIGALGSFGFPEGSTIAQALSPYLQSPETLDAGQINRFTQLVEQLHQSVEQSSADELTEALAAGAPSLLIVSEDLDLSYRLSAAATKLSLQVRVAHTTAQALRLAERTLPQLLLLDAEASSPPEQFQQLSQLAQLATIPFFVIIDHPNLEMRLQMVHQGASQILERSEAPDRLVKTAIDALKAKTRMAKIAIVDDEPQLLAVLQTGLEAWGFQVTPLESASCLWASLEDEPPDALVLDIEMPGINGIELCQVLRADPRWQRLPILFLTVHQDAQVRERAFSAGADDFIDKSVATAELATRILNRLRQVRPEPHSASPQTRLIGQ